MSLPFTSLVLYCFWPRCEAALLSCSSRTRRVFLPRGFKAATVVGTDRCCSCFHPGSSAGGASACAWNNAVSPHITSFLYLFWVIIDCLFRTARGRYRTKAMHLCSVGVSLCSRFCSPDQPRGLKCVCTMVWKALQHALNHAWPTTMSCTYFMNIISFNSWLFY